MGHKSEAGNGKSQDRNRNRNRARKPDAELVNECRSQIAEFALLRRNVMAAPTSERQPRLDVIAITFERVQVTRKLWISAEYLEAFKDLEPERTFANPEDETTVTGGFITRTFDRPEAYLQDEFRSIVNPATWRFNPTFGAETDVVISWHYFTTRQGWMRRGMALPYDPSRMDVRFYRPPAPANKPLEANIRFIPNTDEHGNVIPTAMLEGGYIVQLKANHAYVLEGKWGEKIPVKFISEDPISGVITCASRTVIGSAIGQADEVTEPVFGEDEVLVNGKVHKVWDVVKTYGANAEQSVKALNKRRREMEISLHPDTHPVSKGYKARKMDVPAPVETRRRLDQALAREAFKRAIEIASATHGETGGLNDPEPVETPVIAPVPGTTEAPAVIAEGVAEERPKAPTRPSRPLPVTKDEDRPVRPPPT